METKNTEPSWRVLLVSAIGCGLSVLLGIYFDRIPEFHNLSHACYATAFLLGGWDAAVDTYDRLKRFHLDIHFLMLAVAIGAVRGLHSRHPNM